jgi:predicted ATPase/DNA-binding SARP family transcriptional activator
MRFGILGPLQVVSDDGRELGLGGRMPRAVLALLLLRANEVVASDRLVEELWAGAPPASRAKGLQVHVSRLRRALAAGHPEVGGERLVTAAGGYVLRVGPDELDVQLCERLIGEGRSLLAAGRHDQALAVLSSALELWRGGALSDFEYDAFAQAEIVRLGELRATVREERIAVEMLLGREAQALGELERLVGEYPYRERLRGQLMLALYRTGRQAEALAAYRAARSVLVDELGIEPSVELRQLHEAILAQDGALLENDSGQPRAPAGAGAGGLSAHRTSFSPRTNLGEDQRLLVGRDGDLDELCALLRRERFVSVVGAGGAGKTRLALAAARLLLDEFPGGAFLVSLAPVTDPDAMLDAVVRALDLRGADDAPAARVAEWVRDRPTLLVLDNFEQLLPAAPLVSQLVGQAPELRVLVTSQAALRVTGEVMMGLDGLELGAAAYLFVALARGADRHLAAETEDRDAIDEICRRVGCLPLAVELAAARAALLAPKQLLVRLEASSDVLRRVARDAPPRQRSLRATFEWTYGLLAPSERLLFRRLGVFAGPAGVDTIEAVCAMADGEEPGVALDALEGLLEFSLVRRHERTDGSRQFTMPQALRDFARAELEASGEADAVRRVHAEHVLNVADGARVWFAADPAATASVSAVEAEIRPALAWASAHDPELYRRLVCALALGLIRRGHVAEALGHATRACATLPAPRDEIDAWIANCRAYALEMSGRLEEGEAAIKPAIAFYRTGEHRIGLGLALHTAGWLATDVGDEERSLQLGRESLELLRSTGDPALTGRALGFLIEVLLYRGAFEEGEQLLAEAAASVTDPESDLAGMVATTKGDLAMGRGDVETALTHFANSLDLAARRRDGVQVINDAHCIAYALATAGRPEAALEAAGTAAALAADAGHSAVSNWAARGGFDLAATIGQARHAVGQRADQLEAHGRDLPPGDRIAHLLTLASTVSPNRRSRPVQARIAATAGCSASTPQPPGHQTEK